MWFDIKQTINISGLSFLDSRIHIGIGDPGTCWWTSSEFENKARLIGNKFGA
jgi:hypothetical protein